MNLIVAHILRGLQLLLAIIVLGLAGETTNTEPTDRSNFMIFVAVWTILVVFYFMLAPRFFPAAAHNLAKVGVDSLTMLFWFASFIAMAVLMRNVRLTRNLTLSHTPVWHHLDHWYKVGTAATVFGSFEWLLFVATMVLTLFEAFGNGGSHKPAANIQPQFTV